MYRIILLLLLGNIVSSISIVAQHDYPKALNLSTYFWALKEAEIIIRGFMKPLIQKMEAH